MFMSDNCNNKIIQNIRTKIRQICANIFAKSNIEEKDGFKIGRIDILRMEQGAYPLFVCVFLFGENPKGGFYDEKIQIHSLSIQKFQTPSALAHFRRCKRPMFPVFCILTDFALIGSYL